MCYSTWKVTATKFSVFNFLNVIQDVGLRFVIKCSKMDLHLAFFLLFPIYLATLLAITIHTFRKTFKYASFWGMYQFLCIFEKRLKLMFLHQFWDGAQKEAFLMWNSLTFFVISHCQSELHFGLFGHRTNCLHGIWPSTLLDCRLFGKLPVFCWTHLRRSFFQCGDVCTNHIFYTVST